MDQHTSLLTVAHQLQQQSQFPTPTVVAEIKISSVIFAFSPLVAPPTAVQLTPYDRHLGLQTTTMPRQSIAAADSSVLVLARAKLKQCSKNGVSISLGPGRVQFQLCYLEGGGAACVVICSAHNLSTPITFKSERAVVGNCVLLCCGSERGATLSGGP